MLPHVVVCKEPTVEEGASKGIGGGGGGGGAVVGALEVGVALGVRLFSWVMRKCPP